MAKVKMYRCDNYGALNSHINSYNDKYCYKCIDIDTGELKQENQSQQDTTEDKGNTSPSLPPRKNDESLDGGCDEDSLAPADTLVSKEAIK